MTKYYCPYCRRKLIFIKPFIPQQKTFWDCDKCNINIEINTSKSHLESNSRTTFKITRLRPTRRYLDTSRGNGKMI